MQFIKARFEPCVDSFMRWLLRKDTVLLELYLGFGGLISAFQTLSYDEFGHSVAPYTLKAIDLFKAAGHAWMVALAIFGIMAILATFFGELKGDFFKARSVFQIILAVLFGGVAAAMFVSSLPIATAWRYVELMLFSFATFTILRVRHDVWLEEGLLRERKKAVT